MNYRITGGNEVIKEAIIEKTGVVASFSMNQIEAHEVQLKSAQKELLAKREIEKAKASNIEEHHAFVKDMSDQDLFTCHMYCEVKGILNNVEKQIKAIEAQLTDYDAEKAEIIKQIPELGGPSIPAIAVAETEPVVPEDGKATA